MPKPKIDRFLEQTLLEDELENHGFGHLSVRVHGNHLVIFTKDENEVVSRARLTKVSPVLYTQHGKSCR